jgi:pyridoxamine 5'-phosphate oxidase
MNSDLLPPLDALSAEPTPWGLFSRWFAEAETAGFVEPAAAALATVAADGAPSARMVLVRGFDESGLVFFTNYQSRKAADLAGNARAALVLYWDRLKRQVRIEGSAALVSAQESDVYFRTRPRGHRLSAVISPQSEVIPDRRFLEQRMHELEAQFAGRDDILRPANWGGYRVAPTMFEFWQGRDNRLHDRLRYRRNPDGSWTRERLAP